MSISTQEYRQWLAAWQTQINQGGRSSRRLTRELLGTIETLIGEVETAQAELRRRDDLTYAYGRLVADWNGLVEAMKLFDIAISQPAAIAPRWAWRWGSETGEAPTIPAAYLAALRAAGARKPGLPPLDQQLRAAGAPELPGLALDPPPTCAECGLPLLNGHILDEVVVVGPSSQQRRVHRVCADYLTGHGWKLVAIARGPTHDA